jgi:hypothetical protein
MHHLLSRRNFHGAVVKLDHGIRLLDAFPSVCHGIDVLRLRTDAAAARAALLDLGPTRLSEFPPSLVPKVHLIDETVASDSGSASAGRDGADGNSVGGDRRLAGMHDETTA